MLWRSNEKMNVNDDLRRLWKEYILGFLRYFSTLTWTVTLCLINDAFSTAHAVIGTVPVTVAERSKACTVFSHSEAGIVGSNSIQGTDVWCVYVFILCLCCPLFR
jgi:hypothetical protein